jgi:hypothetical protein
LLDRYHQSSDPGIDQAVLSDKSRVGDSNVIQKTNIKAGRRTAIPVVERANSWSDTKEEILNSSLTWQYVLNTTILGIRIVCIEKTALGVFQ